MANLLSFEPLEGLFDPLRTNPVDELKKIVAQDAQLKYGLKGFPEQIKLDVASESDIISKQVDPHSAMGYLVFKDEDEYNSWMQAQLFEPTQDQVMEALSDGSGS